MKRKVLFILIFFFVSLFVISFYGNWRNHSVDKSLYITNMETVSTDDLLKYGFENNENITIGQCLTFLCRINGYNVKNFDEVKEISEKLGVSLPSRLVYDSSDWKNLWINIIKGNTLFEQVNEETYSVDLIPNFYSIYLNRQGYECIKQGMIPPQLFFYSPFSTISDLEDINLNKKATVGFVLDILMTNCVHEGKENIIRTIVVEKVEGLIGVRESEWGSLEKDLFNYYALNYYGEYSYIKNSFNITEIPFDNLSSNLTVNDFLILFKQMNS